MELAPSDYHVQFGYLNFESKAQADHNNPSTAAVTSPYLLSELLGLALRSLYRAHNLLLVRNRCASSTTFLSCQISVGMVEQHAQNFLQYIGQHSIAIASAAT